MIGKYEVGWYFNGCAENGGQLVVVKQRESLQKLLADCGNVPDDWELPPEIRSVHNHGAEVRLGSFGTTLEVNTSPCYWGVYGIRYGTDGPHKVDEGVRLPEGERC